MRWALLLLALLAGTAEAQVPHNTPIPLMLLKDIGSSSSYEGDLVPLVVTKDIEIDGTVLIPEGTMAFARISDSRREGALSASFFDKPARLAIHLEHLRDCEGRTVRLLPKPYKAGDLQITREMTVKPNSVEAKEYESAWENSTTQPIMSKIHRLFSDSATSLSIGEAQTLIAHNVAMPAVQEAIKNGVFGSAVHFILSLRHGLTVEALLSLTPTTRPALIAMRAVRELCRISGGTGSYIEGRFKGRNIRCAAGVVITVYSG